MSKDKKGGMAIMSTQRGDKSEREQEPVLTTRQRHQRERKLRSNSKFLVVTQRTKVRRMRERLVRDLM